MRNEVGKRSRVVAIAVAMVVASFGGGSVVAADAASVEAP